ncbi:hypothetical protein [Paraburkholderia xenovorans]|jgi:hypothetical protein
MGKPVMPLRRHDRLILVEPFFAAHTAKINSSESLTIQASGDVQPPTTPCDDHKDAMLLRRRTSAQAGALTTFYEAAL